MLVKGRQDLAKTDRGSCCKEEWLEEFLDSKGAFCNGKKGDDNDGNNGNNGMEITNSSSYWRVLRIVATK